MLPIDVTNNPWHLRFITFMGDSDLAYFIHHHNTCSYLRAFMAAVMKLVALSLAVFLFSMSFAFGFIWTSIYLYEVGFSWHAIIAAREALEGNDVAIISFILFVSITAAAAGVAAVLGLVCLASMVLDRGRPSFVTLQVQNWHQSSAGQIVSAWHNKICRPIKFKEPS